MESRRKSMALASVNASSPSDPLSALPDSIIFRIFSFLEPNQTVRLSSVSKRFHRLCSRSPCLAFSANFDSPLRSLPFVRYSQFCNYVVEFMKRRAELGIRIDRFLFHWMCEQPSINVGAQVLDSCLKMAARCNVRELDIALSLRFFNKYTLPPCVYDCPSLRVLRLNLRMGELVLKIDDLSMENGRTVSVEVFSLESAILGEAKFWRKLSYFWTSLTRLNLDNVCCNSIFHLEISSLEEMNLSNCELGAPYLLDWNMKIVGSSLKSLSFLKCHFRSQSQIILHCLSLVNFRVSGSDFQRLANIKIVSECLDNVAICRSKFRQACVSSIYCPSVKQVKINGCKFKKVCQLKLDSLSVGDLTVSDCEVIHPESKIPDPCRRMNIVAERLQTLTINSSDKYLYKFPLYISAPSLRDIVWKGHPLDFSYLNSLSSLEIGVVDIRLSCQHKSKKLTCCCKLFKSSIYCVAMLLQSLKHARFLEINFWPVELFFMQNEEPIFFMNMLKLSLIVDDLSSDKLPVIGSLLKGIPKLISLMIKCEKKSNLLEDPNIVDLLGLCVEAYVVSVNEDRTQVTIVRENGVQMKS